MTIESDFTLPRFSCFAGDVPTLSTRARNLTATHDKQTDVKDFRCMGESLLVFKSFESVSVRNAARSRGEPLVRPGSPTPTPSCYEHDVFADHRPAAHAFQCTSVGQLPSFPSWRRVRPPHRLPPQEMNLHSTLLINSFAQAAWLGLDVFARVETTASLIGHSDRPFKDSKRTTRKP